MALLALALAAGEEGQAEAEAVIAPDVTRLSPNSNPYPVLGHTVIVHATRSGVSMNPTEFSGTLNYMTAPGNNTSHWVIARDGRTARVIPDNRQAWHSQEDNDNAWGIELEQGVENDGFTVLQLASLVRVCRGYMEDFAIPPVHARWSNEAGFIGHEETAQGKRNGKSDPGHLFPWSAFIATLAGGDDDMTAEEETRLALIRMLAAGDYKVQPVGTNGLGQVVARIKLADGNSEPDPPIVVAVTK